MSIINSEIDNEGSDWTGIMNVYETGRLVLESP